MGRDTELGTMTSSEFSIGRVLRDALHILRSSAGNCTTVVVAYIVLWHVAFLLADDVPAGGFGWWNLILREVWIAITGGVATASLTYSTLVVLSGSRPWIRDLGRGLTFAVGARAVFFIVSLLPLCSTLLGAMDSDSGQVKVLQLAIVFASCILNALWFVAAPALITEGLGPLAALWRSAALTAGQRWPIFCLVASVGLMFWGLQWAVMLLGDTLNAQVSQTEPNYIIYWVGDYVVPAMGLVIWTVVQTAAYATLRFAKESGSAEDLARIFD